MTAPILKSSFSAGEVSPSLYGRLDLAKWHSACSVARNFFVSYRGGLLSRGGLAYVGVCKQPASANSTPPRNIEFTFNIFQSYILEFGEQYMRVVANGGYVTENALTITGATRANPCSLTIPGHTYVAGDQIFLTAIGGMTQLNGRTVTVATAAANTVTINDIFGSPINSIAYGAYTAGGTAARLYTLATPYHAIDLPYLKFTQSADVMSLTCVNQGTQTEYQPQELSRLAANNWTMGPPQFASSIAAPNACTVTGTAYSAGAGPAAYGYVATAVDANTGEESQPSPIGVVKNVVDIAGQFGTNSITCSAVTGASKYNFYRAAPDYTNSGNNFGGQLFGYVGSSNTNSWQDTNIIADFNTVPPQHSNPFARGQILNIAMSQFGTLYTAATASVSITSVTGTGFIGIPIIGASLTGQRITFAANPFTTNGVIVSQQVGASTAMGIIVANTATTIDVALIGTTQFPPPGQSTTPNPVTDQAGNNALSTAVANITLSGSGGIVGVFVENPGFGFLSTDTAVFADSGTGSGAVGTLVVGPQSGTYPGVVAYFQQRRAYAATLNQPDTEFFSQPGAFTNFDSGDPPIDSDAIVTTPWAEQINTVQWMLPMPGGLVTFTGKTTWQVSGAAGQNSPITPASQQAIAQEGLGCSPTVPPQRIRYNLLYPDSLSGSINEVNYNFYFNIYTGQDVSVLSSHLFQGFDIREWAWCFNPYRIQWMIRNDGKLISLTYVQEQEVRGFARHDTNGLFCSVAVASEKPANAPYFIVKRFIRGVNQWVYMQERMDNRLWANVEQSYCLDSASSLPQPTPNATLSASAAFGNGVPTLSAIIQGGTLYTAPVGVVVDQAGIGSGGTATFGLTAGVITSVNLIGGTKYQKPQLQITDSTGSGAIISLVADNSVTFTADQNVFDGVNTGVVGQVLRMGGGIGTVSAYVSPTQIVAQVPPQSQITTTLPNDPFNTPVPATPGNWTLTTPVSTVFGLEHLKGMTVNALCDGFPVLNLIVAADGSVVLPNPASQTLIGLPFTAQAQSMHADMPGEMIQGKRMRIQAVTTRLANSRGLLFGQDQPIAAEQPNQAELPWNVSPNFMTAMTEPQMLAGAGNALPLYSGDKREVIAGDYQMTTGAASRGMVAVMQNLPLPAEVLAFIPEMELGDVPNG
jgi:hypothetical protein